MRKNGGSVIFNFKGDTKDAKSKLTELVGNFKTAGKIITASIGTGMATLKGAMIGAVKSSVKAYAEFEQLNGGLEALFGKGSANMQRVIKMSESAYSDLTMSQNQYLDAFQKSYSIINNGIGKNADAIEYTNKMLSISSDLYNTYGGTVETYQSAINWALKGTYSYLDNLNVGIKGTKEGFIEAANKSGVLKKNIKDTSELTNDEILNVIEYYTKSAGALNRTQEEAASTIQGSMNMMKSSWQNLIEGMADADKDIDKLMKQFIKSAGTFIENIMPIIQTAIDSVLEYLPNLLKEITNRLPQALTIILGTLIGMIPSILSILIDLTINVLQALTEALPSLIPTLINGILDALLMLLDNIDIIIDCGIKLMFGLIDGLTSAIPTLIEKAPVIIIKLIGALIRNIPKIIVAMKVIPLKIWDGIIRGLPELIRNVPQIIRDIITALKGEFTKLKDLGKNIIKGIWTGAKNMKDWVVDKFKGIGKSILTGMKKALGIKSPSKEFAIIGRFSMLGYQEGLEQMQPQIDKAINGMFNLSPSMTGTMNNTLSPNINVMNNVNVETDPLGQVVSKIKTFSGGAKNDYNYGYGG